VCGELSLELRPPLRIPFGPGGSVGTAPAAPSSGVGVVVFAAVPVGRRRRATVTAIANIITIEVMTESMVTQLAGEDETWPA
jgi:hypothetical protein